MVIWLRISAIVLTVFWTAGSAFAASVSRVDFDAVNGQNRVIISYSASVSAPKIFTLDGGNPRIVVDLPDTNPQSTPANISNEVIKSVRQAVRGQGARLVIDLTSGARLSRHEHSGNKTVVFLTGQSSKPLMSPTVTTSRISQKSQTGIAIPRLKPVAPAQLYAGHKPLIVIDAGHGGYDPGAIGGLGTKEKTVTLAAAKELEKQLISTGRYDVLLTRSKDVYVDHYERVRRARARDADLFISLHADSLDSKSTRGASVYTLADYAKGRGAKLVDRQNWIMDVDLTEQPDAVGDILVSLAQSKTFSNSHSFAQILIPEIAKVTPILRNTHRRKGLAVLLAPDVPAVLLEMGYISNSKDEKALLSPSHRRKTMQAVTHSIDVYFSGQTQ